MTKNQTEAATAYYKAVHEEKKFAFLTNQRVAEVLTQRLGFKVSETATRNIRVDLGLSTKKQAKIEPLISAIDAAPAIKILAKTQSSMTHIVIAMLNRSPGFDQPAKELMLCNLNSIKRQTEDIAKGLIKKRKACILPRGYPTTLGRQLRAEGKTDQQIVNALKAKYIEVGVREPIALAKAENIVKHKLNRQKK